MEEITIVLLDIGGIQEYVFGSNKLKENIGGSTLVEKAYERFLKEAIKAHFQENQICFDGWRKHPERLCLDNGVKAEVGYIGGGNALLLLKDKKKAQDVIEEWTRKLLICAPGLKTHAAMKTISGNTSLRLVGCWRAQEPSVCTRWFLTLLNNKGWLISLVMRNSLQKL